MKNEFMHLELLMKKIYKKKKKYEAPHDFEGKKVLFKNKMNPHLTDLIQWRNQ